MATEAAGKAGVKGIVVASQSKSGSLISPKLLLFMAVMLLANIGGNMYEPLLPLYLKELNASVIQIGLFFTLSRIIPLALHILGRCLSAGYRRDVDPTNWLVRIHLWHIHDADHHPCRIVARQEGRSGTDCPGIHA